jgi:hypothetical protein
MEMAHDCVRSIVPKVSKLVLFTSIPLVILRIKRDDHEVIRVLSRADLASKAVKESLPLP